MRLLANRIKSKNGKTQVPVWFMRQAGRYHNHYQNIKKNSDFISMCKTPTLACEITMGPIRDFGFDAAILFSDLLFPLEQLGLGLSYNPGPQLKYLLTPETKLQTIEPAQNFYRFQKEALQLIKPQLTGQTLIGFVGAPFTLFAYACEGAHAGELVQTKQALEDGRYQKFTEILLPELIECMQMQVQGGADMVCLFDTAAGVLSPQDYQRFVVPILTSLTREFKSRCPSTTLVYFSKGTNLHHLERLETDDIDVIAIDWRMDISCVLKSLADNYYIQGNIDPAWLLLPWEQLEKRLNEYWKTLQSCPLNKWICNLGHGVLPKTPQDNVQKTVQYIHDHFCY